MTTPSPSLAAPHIVWHRASVDRPAREKLLGQRGRLIWFTGLSGSGKSTIASALDVHLHRLGRATYLLDGDNVRHGLCRDLTFSDADRKENIRRIAEAARLLVDAGLIVLTAAISPFREDRAMARSRVDPGDFLEVFVDTPLEVCESRDPKGLYQKARQGIIPSFTGISSPYEAPEQPDVHIRTIDTSIEDAVTRIAAKLLDSEDLDARAVVGRERTRSS